MESYKVWPLVYLFFINGKYSAYEGCKWPNQYHPVVQLQGEPSKHNATGGGLWNTSTNKRRLMRAWLALRLWEHRFHSWESENSSSLPFTTVWLWDPGHPTTSVGEVSQVLWAFNPEPLFFKETKFSLHSLPCFQLVPKVSALSHLPPATSSSHVPEVPCTSFLCRPPLPLHLSTPSTLSSGNFFKTQLPFVFNCFSELHTQ